MAISIQPTDFRGAEVAALLTKASSQSSIGSNAYAGAQTVYSPAEQAIMAQLAQRVLQDPVLMMQLCDRIFELFRDDLKLQQDRSQHIGRHF